MCRARSATKSLENDSLPNPGREPGLSPASEYVLTREQSSRKILNYSRHSAGREVAAPEVVNVMGLGRTLHTLVFAAALALLPAVASAVTVDQIVALSKAGVSEAIILALIERDKTLLTIEPDQIVALQRDGVSEKVIVAMLKSGRAEGDEAARNDAAYSAATIMSRLPTTPDLVVVGHGPDTPNTNYAAGFYSSYPAADVPLIAPYGYGSYGVFASPRQQRQRRSFFQDGVNPLFPPQGFCVSQPSTGRVPPSVGTMGFVTACPPALQNKRLR
jgi:hypothetical protein